MATTVDGFLSAIEAYLRLDGGSFSWTDTNNDTAKFREVWRGKTAVQEAVQTGGPCALVVNLGGAPHPSSKKIYMGTLQIVAIDCHPRDHVGHTTRRNLDIIGDALLDALDRAASPVGVPLYFVADADGEDELSEGGLLFVSHSWQFRYELVRE